MEKPREKLFAFEVRKGNFVSSLRSTNLAGESGPAHDSAPERHSRDTACGDALMIIVDRPNFAVGQEGERSAFFHPRDVFPVRGLCVHFHFGARVDHDVLRPAFFHRMRDFANEVFVIEAQSDFGRHGNRSRSRDRFQNVKEAFGRLEKSRASVMPVHRFCGAAEIQIHARSTELADTRGILRERTGLTAKQLNENGSTGLGAAAVGKFRAVFIKNVIRLKPVGHAHEFRDHAVKAADFAE